jgi:hypothetical protein
VTKILPDQNKIDLKSARTASGLHSTDQNKIDLKSARTASGLHSSSHVSSTKDQQMNPYMISSNSQIWIS